MASPSSVKREPQPARNTDASSSSVNLGRLFLGLLGVGSGSSVLAFLSGDESNKSDMLQPTLGEFLSHNVGRVIDGYQHIVTFFASMDLSTAGSLAAVTLALFAKLYNRRITTTVAQKQYFDGSTAGAIPHTRIGYSDRMSYIMGELAELAYIPAENVSHALAPVINPLREWQQGAELSEQKQTQLNQLLDSFSFPQSSYQDALLAGLRKGELEYVGPYLSNQTVDLTQHQTPNIISKLSAQGYVSLHRNIDTKKSFIVVAFRGSEVNVEDWLTNANAKPLADDELAAADAKLTSLREKYGFTISNNRIGRVHSGFYGAFLALAPQLMKNIYEAKQALGHEHCPVFFTGHSLGGAIATIAARELLPDSNGAVYSFGAPRVADYNYFNGMKTPIFRIVNSSDVVPRVPPGVFAPIFKLPIYAVRWIFAIRQGVENKQHPFIANVLAKAEQFFDDLSYYRHYGDLRYLTDVADSKEIKPDILSNPSKFDQIFWFCTSVGASFGKPVRSHSMQIYRNKLKNIALARNSQ
ncbi:lipase family protein [Glaciecola sp. MH2013]|uniref:lipase family protein n=1 Tax=Glaciecola sp. MH2013 TaxID=2785524 RepID=UPI0018A0116A|nr:lipase family protein [Glaciecola sp. MH2013]MBF7073334.1 lipase family protein [Glaciecola sp. MH2013]